MNLSRYASKQLAPLVSGDDDRTKRLSGSKLVDLFNSFGERDEYIYPSIGIVDNSRGDTGASLSRNDYVAWKIEFFSGSKRLKDLLERLINTSEDRASVAEAIRGIIHADGNAIQETDGIYSIITGVAYEEPVEAQAHFKDLQQKILQAIQGAQISIQAAIAWLTDPVLFNALLLKKQEGLTVEVLLIDDHSNRSRGLPHDQLGSIWCPKRGRFQNMMHNKYCIIDTEIVITGSYNWSVAAQYHDENVAIVLDRKLAKQYAGDFVALKKAFG
jgi:phosphatidylserine/phosphatidylglycerophosphate/cardiolipin synthase-like enzyme